MDIRTKRFHRMQARRNASAKLRSDQKGAVLAIGLILLAVLTLWGVQAMRSNLSQERMAFNMRDRNVAFQAAEAALRVGEVNGPFDSSGVALADPMNWGAGEETGTLVDFDGDLSADPKYHVGPPQYVRVGIVIPPEYRLIYPIGAQAQGSQPGSIVILQSGFEPAN
ncbi:PilX N-terminal domain-containing pilus assembly protein [Hydrogenophaga sp. 5NK40-0174]|uniref:pilus assembly PilX family protein n=1 Tax=Hydrogenophaga sp. 5NK40-0174 TaxID=3127649 RepID=UPI00310B7345